MSDNPWNIPLSFYFLVTFQNTNGVMFNASFREVEGLGWTLNMEDKETSNGVKLKMPKSLSFSDLVLKCPLAPLSTEFSGWIDACVKKMSDPSSSGPILQTEACNVVVKLLDRGGKPWAVWSFGHAYPCKYSLGSFNAESSALAIETVTLVYVSVERKQ